MQEATEAELKSSKRRILLQGVSGFQKKIWKFIGGEANEWGFVMEYPVQGYFADFLSPKLGLVIEADGPHHALPDRKKADAEREAVLVGLGLRVFHITPAMFVMKSPIRIFEELEAFIGLPPTQGGK